MNFLDFGHSNSRNILIVKSKICDSKKIKIKYF